MYVCQDKYLVSTIKKRPFEHLSFLLSWFQYQSGQMLAFNQLRRAQAVAKQFILLFELRAKRGRVKIKARCETN